LSTDRETATMAEATVTAEVHEALNVELNLITKLTLYLKIGLDDVAYFTDFTLVELMNSPIWVEPNLRNNLLRCCEANSIDIGQRDF
jgi:hypothetical protein